MEIKKICARYFILSLLLSWLAVNSLYGQLSPRTSQNATVTQRVGWTHITVTYSRPNVNQREIWGELVPYDMEAEIPFGDGGNMPWRAGANENTVISFSTDVKIEGNLLKAGEYGIHMMIHRDGKATVIFSTNSKAWGSFSYKEEEDALRVKVTSQENPFRESLMYSFSEVQAGSTILTLEWGRKRIPIKIEVINSAEIILAILKNELDGRNNNNWNDYQVGVSQALRNSDTTLALKWAEISIEKSEGHVDAYLDKFNIIYADLNKITEADQIIEQVLKEERSNFRNQNIAYNMISRLVKGRRITKAMEVYERYGKEWEDHWLMKHALARIYSAQGKYKKALALEEGIVDKIPDNWDLTSIIQSLKNKEDFNLYVR